MKEMDVNTSVFTTASKPDYLQGKVTGGCEGGSSKKSSASETNVNDAVKEEKGKKVEY